jgi:hypothetical protein
MAPTCINLAVRIPPSGSVISLLIKQIAATIATAIKHPLPTKLYTMK